MEHDHEDSPDDVGALQNGLVDALVRSGAIRSAAVEAAFRGVPRHLFLPGVALEQVYSDQAITTKQSAEGVAISSSTQPVVMAGMLEQLQLEPGQRVLEIGAGTGFNAALMAHIVGDTGQVVTVDVDAEVVAVAREHLAAAGYERVRVVHGDGVLGYAEGAPYDRIILTVGAHDIAPAWREQLAPGGRLVLPLVLRARQRSIAFEDIDGTLTSASIRSGIVFMPLRDTAITARNVVPLADDYAMIAEVEDAARIDPQALLAALDDARAEMPVDSDIQPGTELADLATWLELREPGFCHFFARASDPASARLPNLAGNSEFKATFGLFANASLAILDRDATSDTPALPLVIRHPGTNPDLAQRLLAEIRAWDAAGRPTEARLRIRAHFPTAPRDAQTPAPTATIQKHWTELICDWPECG